MQHINIAHHFSPLWMRPYMWQFTNNFFPEASFNYSHSQLREDVEMASVVGIGIVK
jgi:hypothetical protein